MLIPGDGFPALKDEGQDRVAGWIKRDGGGLAVPEFCDFELGQKGFGPDLSSLLEMLAFEAVIVKPKFCIAKTWLAVF